MPKAGYNPATHRCVFCSEPGARTPQGSGFIHERCLPPEPEPEPKRCAYRPCSASFIPRWANQRYCCPRHRNNVHHYNHMARRKAKTQEVDLNL